MRTLPDSYYEKLEVLPLDTEKWIPYDGKGCPIPYGLRAEIKFHDGSISIDIMPKWNWSLGRGNEIVAWRLLDGWIPSFGTLPKVEGNIDVCFGNGSISKNDPVSRWLWEGDAIIAVREDMAGIIVAYRMTI